MVCLHVRLILPPICTGCAPNGIWVFRSSIFGGMSAEVTTIFNESKLPEMLKSNTFPHSIGPFIFSLPAFAAYGLVPKEGLAPGVKIGVADSAYTRSSLEKSMPLWLPTKLPNDGSNPRVRFCPVAVQASSHSNCQGADLKATHRVQTHRGMIERQFAILKNWHGLFGGKCESIDTLEMELDSAMALDNLNLRHRLELTAGIPKRAPFAPNSHIITPDRDVDLHIPKSIALESPKFPAHLKHFHTALTSLVPHMSRAIQNDGKDALFSNRIVKRADNLLKGGNVLHIGVQDAGAGHWWVRVSAGASMKSTVYNCWVDLLENVGVVGQAGQCKNG